MPKNPKPISDQQKRFVETARALECDEDKERFEEKLGRIARVKSAAKPAPRPKSERK
jgi:hypothetical protein